MKTGESSARKQENESVKEEVSPKTPVGDRDPKAEKPEQTRLFPACRLSSPWWAHLQGGPSLFFQRETGTGCPKPTQKLCCCPASGQPSPAGTESAAYPRGAPHRSKKSRWQSCGSYHFLCSTGHCHGALPTPGRISCKGDTKQSGAEPPLRPHLSAGTNSAAHKSRDTAQGELRSIRQAPDASRVGSPGAGPYVPVADVGVIPTRKEKGGSFIEDIKDSSSTVEVSP